MVGREDDEGDVRGCGAAEAADLHLVRQVGGAHDELDQFQLAGAVCAQDAHLLPVVEAQLNVLEDERLRPKLTPSKRNIEGLCNAGFGNTKRLLPRLPLRRPLLVGAELGDELIVVCDHLLLLLLVYASANGECF